MGFRLHRSKEIFPGVRLNFSKSGIGFSFGKKGMRYSIGPNGGRTTIGISGTGLSYISYSGSKNSGESLSSNLSGSNISETVYYKSGDLKLPVMDSTYRDLIELSRIDIVSAVEIYCSAVGFLPDKKYRVCKETGEKYEPSNEHLGVEQFLLQKWNSYQATIYNRTHIQPAIYLLLSVLMGWLGVHRFVVGQKTEGFCRGVLFIIAFFCSWHFVMFLCFAISIVEGAVTMFVAEKDENGNVIPFGIWDIALMIHNEELATGGRYN